MRDDLIALAERVEKAEGPDRELDHWIALWCRNDGRTGALRTPKAWVKAATEQNWGSPHYTSDLNAVLALIERKLPGWALFMLGDSASGDAGALAITGASAKLTNGATDAQGAAKTRALALLGATLKAIAQEQNHAE